MELGLAGEVGYYPLAEGNCIVQYCSDAVSAWYCLEHSCPALHLYGMRHGEENCSTAWVEKSSA
jgi:hypothetical protein